MAVLTENAFGKMHIALAVGLKARMACIAGIAQRSDRGHAIGMGAVHGMGHGFHARLSRGA